MWDEIESASKVAKKEKFLLVIAAMLGWFLHFLRAISTSLKLFSVKVALSVSVSIPKFLAVLKNYSLNIFAFLISLSIVSSINSKLIW